jgi:hypothetical protein
VELWASWSLDAAMGRAVRLHLAARLYLSSGVTNDRSRRRPQMVQASQIAGGIAPSASALTPFNKTLGPREELPSFMVRDQSVHLWTQRKK